MPETPAPPQGGRLRAIVEALDQNKALRRGLDVTRATDILWTLNHPDVWLLLAGHRGWSPDEFEQWFADTVRAQLLRAPTRRRRARRGGAGPTLV